MGDGQRIDESETALPISAWLERLAGAQGSPGGGAACALMLATACALLQMVAGYSAADARATGSQGRLEHIRERALDAAELDSRRSGRLGTALRESGDSGDDDDPVPAAALTAADTALRLHKLAEALLPELELLLEIADRYLMPDLVVAATTATAALRGAAAIGAADIRLADAHTSSDNKSEVREATAEAQQTESVRRRFEACAAKAEAHL